MYSSRLSELRHALGAPYQLLCNGTSPEAANAPEVGSSKTLVFRLTGFWPIMRLIFNNYAIRAPHVLAAAAGITEHTQGPPYKVCVAVSESGAQARLDE